MRDNNYYNDYNQYDDGGCDNGVYGNDNKKKILIIVSVVITVCILIFAGIFLKNKLEISSLQKKAQSLVEMEDYDEALKIYSDLYTKTGNVKFKSDRNQVALKKEVKDTLKDAKEQEQKGDLVKAIVIYKMVPKEDNKNYQFASTQINSLKNDVIRKANSLIASGNNSEASTLLSDYISVIPDDKNAVELYKKASGKSDKEVEKVVVQKNVPVIISDNSGGGGSSANDTARAITNTYQYITSGEANVRSAPSKGAAVVGTVSRGDQVYIYDTYVESEKRIWCKTELGWISYDTMNNTIR